MLIRCSLRKGIAVMMDAQTVFLNRRVFMGGVGAIGGLLVTGCVGVKTFVFSRVIRHLMVKSADNAIETMLAPGGYWDQAVYNSQVGSFLGSYSYLAKNALTSDKTKDRLDKGLGNVARTAAKESAPVIGKFVAKVGIKDAKAIAEGGPTAAADYIRENGTGIVAKAMNSEILAAMRNSDEPIVRQMIDSLPEVDRSQLAANVAAKVANIMWDQIGIEEAKICADPSSTNDPVLIEYFGKRMSSDG